MAVKVPGSECLQPKLSIFRYWDCRNFRGFFPSEEKWKAGLRCLGRDSENSPGLMCKCAQAAVLHTLNIYIFLMLLVEEIAQSKLCLFEIL